MESLTLAANTFINDILVPRLAAEEAGPSIRGLAVPQLFMETYASDGLFDAAVSVGVELRLPEPWSSTLVGDIRYGLFGAPSTAARLGPRPSTESIREHHFVAPIYVSREGAIVLGDDRCPIARRDRNIRHEVETIALACRVAAETDHLVFGPVVAAGRFISSGALVELNVPGWSVLDPLFLACNGRAIRKALRDALAELVGSAFGEPGVTVSGAVSLPWLVAAPSSPTRVRADSSS